MPDEPPPNDLKPLAAAVITRGDRVLLTGRRSHEFGEVWSWPSGKVEQGETLEEAIVRELYEELLLEGARIIRRLGDIDLPSGFRMTHFHVVIPDHVEPVLNDKKTLEQVRWKTRAETEQAFKTLDPIVSARALSFVDDALAYNARTSPDDRDRREPSS